MTKPCIICVGSTGSLPTKDNNPAVAITIAEQIESTQAAFEAGNGRLQGPLYVQFVIGVQNAMPADERSFDFYIETLKRLAPDAE